MTSRKQTPELISGWMVREQRGVKYYTIGYKQTAPDWEVTDLWSKRFSLFKDGNDKSIINCADHLMTTAIRRLVEELILGTYNRSQILFVPALSSDESVANDERSIPGIARSCATACGARYSSELLTKMPYPKLHKSEGWAQRDTTLADANYQCRPLPPEVTVVLVLDDFVTSGTTLHYIQAAIHKVNSTVHVRGIALAQTYRPDQAEKENLDISNGHVISKWDEAWRQGCMVH